MICKIHRGKQRFLQRMDVVDTAKPAIDSDCQREAERDAELAMLVGAWPNLPQPIRAGILAMVNATFRRVAQ